MWLGGEVSNNYIITYTGKKFYILEPTVDMIDISDIAHALSNTCRFTGHTKSFYCPTEEQRILTSDLRWECAGNLKLGDTLVGFDEFPKDVGSGGNLRRRFRPAIITHLQRVKRKVIRLEMSDGSTVRASEEHPWLIATKASRNQKWVTAAKIKTDIEDSNWRYRKKETGQNSKRYIQRFIPVWKEETNKVSGWLAGIFDGEGYISMSNRTGIQMGVAQNKGIIFDEICKRLKEFNIAYTPFKTGNISSKVISCQIKGGFPNIFEVLGKIRPVRLLNKFKNSLLGGDFNKQLDGKGCLLTIDKAYIEKEEWVVGIETNTHTYLCEGFAAHNSVAQHSLLVASLMPVGYMLEGLLHDASETYLTDIATPVKPLLANYRELEAPIMRAIAEKFHLAEDWKEKFKKADAIMLSTEIRDLMGHCEDYGELEKPIHDNIYPLSPEKAEYLFLEMFNALKRSLK